MPNKLVEPTPLPFAIQLSLDSFFILFLSIILIAKRGSSPQTLGAYERRKYEGTRARIPTED